MSQSMSNQSEHCSKAKGGPRRKNDESDAFFHVFFIAAMIVLAIISAYDISNYEWPYDELTYRHSGSVRLLCYSSASIFALAVSFALRLGWTIPVTVIGMSLGFAFTPWDQGGDYDVNHTNQQVCTRWGIVIGAFIGVLLESIRRRTLRKSNG